MSSAWGRVTSAVSARTDYLVAGSILEDRRMMEEGSKYKQCAGLLDGWGYKWRKEYDKEDGGEDGEDGGGKKKRKAVEQKKDYDPNTLVEVVQGLYEFYAMVVFYSEWKKGTLSESKQLELNANQTPLKEEVQKGELTAATSTPSTLKSNPYVGSATSVNSVNTASSASKPMASNPYASASKAKINPYTRKSTPTNPYAKKSPAAANPYA